MSVSLNNTQVVFNDATTQTTSGVTVVNVSTGISSTGGKTPTLTNTGVTSLTAGTGISLSGSTGGVTVTNTVTAPNTNQLVKAWIRFNGQANPVTIYGSYNVSSVTYVNSSTFTLNFTVAMANADYAAASMGEWTNGVSNAGLVCMSRNSPPSTTDFTTTVTGSGGATSLYFYINVAIFSA